MVCAINRPLSGGAMQSQNLYSSSCGGGLSSATTQDDTVPCSESLLNGKSLASYKKMIKEIELDESSSTSKKSNNDEDGQSNSSKSENDNCNSLKRKSSLTMLNRNLLLNRDLTPKNRHNSIKRKTVSNGQHKY